MFLYFDINLIYKENYFYYFYFNFLIFNIFKIIVFINFYKTRIIKSIIIGLYKIFLSIPIYLDIIYLLLVSSKFNYNQKFIFNFNKTINILSGYSDYFVKFNQLYFNFYSYHSIAINLHSYNNFKFYNYIFWIFYFKKYYRFFQY